MISHILFDLDGVLFDGCEFHAEVFINAVNKINTHKITKEFHDKYLNGLSTKQKLVYLADKLYIKYSDINNIYKLKQDLTLNTIEDYLIYSPKLVDICKWLVQNDYKLYCVSNSIKKTIQICLQKLGIDIFFTDIISNEDVANPKPNPEPYLKILTKYKILQKGVEYCVVHFF